MFLCIFFNKFLAEKKKNLNKLKKINQWNESRFLFWGFMII